MKDYFNNVGFAVIVFVLLSLTALAGIFAAIFRGPKFYIKTGKTILKGLTLALEED